MRICYVFALVTICFGLTALGSTGLTASSVTMQRNGAMQIGGRSLKCGSVRNVVDPHLPNLGMASRGILSVNPTLLDRQPPIVRLFVYHHECGHHHVGASELAADCWAAKRGVQDGWLTKNALGQICKSFGNGPATATHPAGPHRCRSLNQCYTVAAAAQAKEQRAAASTAKPASGEPALVRGPKLVREGTDRDRAASTAKSFQ
jgi:hypothetical protein